MELAVIHSILLWSVIAGILQFVGYALYIKYQSKGEIDPNPHTWLMFAYGTIVLTALELDAILSSDADYGTLALLILPLICSLGAIWVYYVVWRNHQSPEVARNPWWPEDFWDRFSLVVDILITVGYVTIWVILAQSLITGDERALFALVLLFLSNASTFPGFVPMAREVWQRPETEDWRPWAMWALAYAALVWATYLETETFYHALMFYPLSNVLMHALISALAIRASKQ